MDFVRVHANNIFNYRVDSFVRRFNDCIVPYEDGRVKLDDESYLVNTEFVTPADCPEEGYEDQPCFQDAGVKLGLADKAFDAEYVYVRVDNTSYKVYRVSYVRGPMVGVLNVCERYPDIKEFRWDTCTVLDNEDADEEDYFTGEPIFTGDCDYETIHGFDRYGHTEDLGYFLAYNWDDDRCIVCDDCNSVFDCESPRFDSFWHSDDWTGVCDSCFEDDYVCCDNCGALIRSDDANYDEDNDAYYCDSCWDYMDHGGRSLHDYGYKPRGVFHPDYKENGLYYGIELEIDKGDSVRKCCQDLYEISDDEDLFYLKHDGSLSDGIEIVTHPCSLDYQLNEMPWDDIAKISLDNGFKSHDANTCGLHVHISRAGLGENRDLQDLHIAKMILWVDRYWDELVNFSRRNYNQLERWAKKPDAKIYSYDNQNTAVSKAKRSGERDRYKAVNLTNEHTVEFRLFRGSLKPQTIKATIEFLSNLIGYTADHSLEDVQDAKWTDVTRYKEYPELMAYLAERNLTDIADKPKPEEPKPVEVRFSVGSVVWFSTENTNNEVVRGTVKSVHMDEDGDMAPLYIVEGDDSRVNFLIDSEILSNEEIAAREAVHAANSTGVAAAPATV